MISRIIQAKDKLVDFVKGQRQTAIHDHISKGVWTAGIPKGISSAVWGARLSELNIDSVTVIATFPKKGGGLIPRSLNSVVNELNIVYDLGLTPEVSFWFGGAPIYIDTTLDYITSLEGRLGRMKRHVVKELDSEWHINTYNPKDLVTSLSKFLKKFPVEEYQEAFSITPVYYLPPNIVTMIEMFGLRLKSVLSQMYSSLNPNKPETKAPILRPITLQKESVKFWLNKVVNNKKIQKVFGSKEKVDSLLVPGLANYHQIQPGYTTVKSALQASFDTLYNMGRRKFKWFSLEWLYEDDNDTETERQHKWEAREWTKNLLI